MSRLRLLIAAPLLACASTPPADGSAPQATASTTQTVRITSVDLAGPLTVFEMASGPDAGSISRYRAPHAQVWAALPQAFQAIGLQGQVLDATAYRYGQPERPGRMRLGDSPLSRYFDCGARGGVPNADNYTVTYTVTAHVEPGVEGTTHLRTLVTATARPAGMGDARVRCSSTGAMERRIHELVWRRLPTAE